MDVRLFPTLILLQTLQIFGLVFQNGMLVMHNFTFILYFVSTVLLKRVFKYFLCSQKPVLLTLWLYLPQNVGLLTYSF